MKKKQIDWETLKYIAIVAQDNECDHWWHQLEDGLAICEKCKKIQ